MKRIQEPLPWLGILLMLMLGVSWAMNFKSLTDCDFKAPYNCEAIHGIGIVPMFSMATVWFESDE